MLRRNKKSLELHGGVVPIFESTLGRAAMAFGLATATGMIFQFCGSSAQSSNPSGSSMPVTQMTTAITVQPATAIECATGGSEIIVFDDANGNGILDPGETVVKTSVICNGATGATGAQGLGAGVMATPASVAACPAGGIFIKTFIDANDNGILDPGEVVTSNSTICNGVAGTNGSSAMITERVATSTECPTGGTMYTLTNPDGTLEQQAVCNGATGATGAPGANATYFMGPVGPPVPGEPYSVCHHDYLYLPGNNGAAGWLEFRHQENGAADQGIGNTGFQVWDVEITDFLLVSEVGNVVYCTMHWDPQALTLSYTVDDTTNGLNGTSGTLNL